MEFNLKAGDLPREAEAMLGSIVRQAREQLRDVDSGTVKKLAAEIHEKRQAFFHDEIEAFIAKQLKDGDWAKQHILDAQAAGHDLEEFVNNEIPTLRGPYDSLRPIPSDITETVALSMVLRDEDLNFEFPRHLWFSVLALKLSGKALELLEHGEHRTAELQKAAILAIHAMKAVCLSNYDFAVELLSSVSIEDRKARQDAVLGLTRREEELRAEFRAEEDEKLRAEMRRISNEHHDRPGGSREKRKKIKEIWASCKYKTKTQCIKKEHERLNMSFGTAQKALQGEPDPQKPGWKRY